MTNPTLLLALDQGTSSSRAIVFDSAGGIVAIAQRELHASYRRPGWVEHDPKEIWRTQLATAREALAHAGAAASAVAAIGIANQRETTLVWNRATGEAIHPAIVWQDRRTEAACVRLRERGLEALVRETTGLRIDAYFSATKLAWILDHVAGARAAAGRGELAFGTVDTWLLWHLTGGRVHATDVTNAARTMLFDIRRGDWDDTLLALFEIPRSLLPAVHASSHLYGHTEAGVLGAPVAIGGVVGDQQGALFGQGCVAPGLAKNTYGTGCFLLMATGERCQTSANGLITTRAAQVATTATAAAPAASAPQFALEGSVFIGGAVVQWLRDGLQAIQASGDVERLAASVPDSGGVVFVPAFTGLGAPYWRADARGAIVGLTRGTTVAHIARAALESIAFQSTALLQAMNRDAVAAGGTVVTELRVDGGACVNDLLMQFQADLLGIPVVRPDVIETTALGAAMLAGLACGAWAEPDAIAKSTASPTARAGRSFRPTLPRSRAEALIGEWERAVAKSWG